MIVNKGIAQIQNCSLEKLLKMRTDSKLKFYRPYQKLMQKSHCKILLPKSQAAQILEEDNI